MNCSQCASVCAEGSKYCANCGTPLDPQTRYLESLTHSQIQDEIQKKFKDHKLVDIETSQAIAERLYLWAKIFAACVALPVAALLIILGIFGINKYSDLARLIDSSEQQIRTQAGQATMTAEQAQKAADGAKAEAKIAEQNIESVSTKLKAQMDSVNQSFQKIQAFSSRVSGLEKQTSTQIHASTERVDQRVSELDKKIDAATQDIAEQQKKLESTDELVKSLFSKGTTEYFSTTVNAANIVIIPIGKGAIGFMLLKSAPFSQTVEMKWRVASQPRSSYQVQNNLLTFYWGESADNLRLKPLEVTYIPDPTSKTPLIKALSVKDKTAFADNRKLMSIP